MKSGTLQDYKGCPQNIPLSSQVFLTKNTFKNCIFKESALGQFFHRVAMSVCLMSHFQVISFEASHWPSGHIISSRPLIGQPSFTTKLSTMVIFAGPMRGRPCLGFPELVPPSVRTYVHTYICLHLV